MKSKVIDPAKTARRLRIIAVFTFVISPLCSWMSVIATDETAVFASLSRMIWFSGSAMRIFIAMLVLFVPMILSFFLALDLSGITRTKVLICRLCLILSCIVLYVGAMELMPASGEVMTRENIWHGVLSFGGMLMIFLTYCLYAFFIRKKDRDGVFLLVCLLVFSLITSAFSVLNIFDERSYVVASAAAELYVLTIMSLVGYLTYYLAYRKMKEAHLIDL